MENLRNDEPLLALNSTSTNKYKWLIDNCLDIISIHAPDGRYRYVSPSFTKTLGYTSAELLHRTPYEFIHCDDQTRAMHNHKRLLLGEETIETTYRQQKKCGEYIWLEAKIKAIRDETGEVIEILSFTRNISDKIKHDIELLEAKMELDNIISNQQGMVIKIIKKDHQYIYTIFAGELVHALGCKPEDVIGKTPNDIFSKETAEYLINLYDLAWTRHEKVSFEYTTDDGRYLLVKIKPIMENGNVIELIGSSVDITPLKEAEKQLIQSEKLSVIGELSAGIAHEIRNPLTAIKGFLQILKMEQDHKYFDIMESEIKRIEMITSEFMVLSKPSVEKRKRLKLCSIIEDVIFLVDLEAFKKRIAIKQTVDQEVFIAGEENQIKQVLLNIMKNAIESMCNKGTIEINVTRHLEKVFINISDQGCGIPKEKLIHLGKPFYTTKQTGNGLGLMISYKIIKEHGGTISVESSPNKGTTFTIELPLLSNECKNNNFQKKDFNAADNK